MTDKPSVIQRRLELLAALDTLTMYSERASSALDRAYWPDIQFYFDRIQAAARSVAAARQNLAAALQRWGLARLPPKHERRDRNANREFD